MRELLILYLLHITASLETGCQYYSSLSVCPPTNCHGSTRFITPSSSFFLSSSPIVFFLFSSPLCLSSPRPHPKLYLCLFILPCFSSFSPVLSSCSPVYSSPCCCFSPNPYTLSLPLFYSSSFVFVFLTLAFLDCDLSHKSVS